MKLLRSGEAPAEGEAMSLDQLEQLSQAWYGDRLDPDWRPRSVDESQRILTDCGLTADFWALG